MLHFYFLFDISFFVLFFFLVNAQVILRLLFRLLNENRLQTIPDKAFERLNDLEIL